MKFKTSFVFVIICSIVLIKCDIPTHCLQHQVVGDWIFYQTEAVRKSLSQLYQHKCGIFDHTKVSEINKFKMNESLFKYSFQIHLSKDHDVKISQTFPEFSGPKNGIWTMVYDEGFEFSLGIKDTPQFSNYFTFLKYSENNNSLINVKSKHYSHCYETLIGWFHTQNDKWGCFYGHKIVPNYQDPTNGEASDKLIVLENSVKPAAFIESAESDFEQESERSNFIDSLKNSRFVETELNNMLEYKSTTNTNASAESYLTLTTEFSNHAEIVERINSLNLSWRAEVYDEFKDLSISALNKISGRKAKGASHSNHRSLFSFINNPKKSPNLKHEKPLMKKSIVNAEKPIKNIDYTRYMGPPKRQGNCGSCFAVSTNTMLEARFRLKYDKTIQKYYDPKKFNISLDHVLKCSYYNQGCNGGYSYLVSKFYKEFEIMPNECFDKETCSNKCIKENTKTGKLRLKVTNYYYVGEYYGYSTEENIYNDLREHGPLVVSLAPNYLFSVYRSGIFDGDNNIWNKLKVKQPEWQRVDHSVVLVGCGIENGIEYWLIQNSWGEHWGEQGYMKLRKGKNLINIESLGEAAQVSLSEDL